MPRIVPVVLAVSVLAGVTVAFADRDAEREVVTGASKGRVAASRASSRENPAAERFESMIDAKPGSRRPLGEFALTSGRSLRLYSVETRAGKSCLVDEEAGVGHSASCLEDGLFGLRRASFSVNTEGGPGRFDALYVVGVVASDVRRAELVDTGGGSHPLELNPERAFLFEASSSDLAAGVHPKALRLYSPSGRLVETIAFPAVG